MKFGHMDEMDNIDSMNYISNYDHVNDTNGLYYNNAMTIDG
jgi:hypothetical protein